MSQTVNWFRNTIKSFLSDNGVTMVKYTFIENNEILNDGQYQYENPLVYLENLNDPIEKLREEHKNHPSILAILQQEFENSFSFRIIPKKKLKRKS